MAPGQGMVSPEGEDGPVVLPIGEELDLHTFAPRDVPSVVEEYVRACREKGILEVRIVHGKGTGALRETVHAVLRRTPGVAGFGLAMGDEGGWGATVVRLEPLE